MGWKCYSGHTRALPAPVLHPGSVERTSFAERDEPKGFLSLQLEADASCGGRLSGWRFHELPTRPMALIEVDATGLDRTGLTARVERRLAQIAPHAVVRLASSASAPLRPPQL